MLDASTRVAAAARSGLIDLRFAPRARARFDFLHLFSARLFCRPLTVLNKYTFCARVCIQICSPPVTHEHSRLPGSSPQGTSRPVGPAPSTCSRAEAAKAATVVGYRSRVDLGGSPHLELDRAPKGCAFEGRAHPPTHEITHNRTQPHAHLGTRRRDPHRPVAPVCCEPNWKGCLRASF